MAKSDEILLVEVDRPDYLPWVGATVHYVQPENKHFDGPNLHPAIVTRIWSETCVNLTVIPDGGVPYAKSSVELNGHDNGSSCGWCWPPLPEAAADERKDAEPAA